MRCKTLTTPEQAENGSDNTVIDTLVRSEQSKPPGIDRNNISDQGTQKPKHGGYSYVRYEKAQ